MITVPYIENGQIKHKPFFRREIVLYINGNEFVRCDSFRAADRILGVYLGSSLDHYNRNTPIVLKNGVEVEVDVIE